MKRIGRTLTDTLVAIMVAMGLGIAAISAIGPQKPPTPEMVTESPIPKKVERGQYGLYVPVSGNMGPFGFDPMFEVNGGWIGWGKKTVETMRKYMVYRVCVWCPDGNTDPRGWRLLPMPCAGEIYDKSKPSPGDKLTFDAGLYHDPQSCDSFERAVADNAAKTAAFKQIVAEANAIAKELKANGGVGVVWVYLGNSFDKGNYAVKPLKDFTPEQIKNRVELTIRPFVDAGVYGIAQDATSGSKAGSLDFQIASQIIASKVRYGVELFPTSDNKFWSGISQVDGFAPGPWYYKLASKDGFFVPRSDVKGRLGVLCVARPDGSWTGGTTSNVSREQAIEFTKAAMNDGVDVYSNYPMTREERTASGIN